MTKQFDDFDTEIQCDENPHLADYEEMQALIRYEAESIELEEVEATAEFYDAVRADFNRLNE